MTKTFTLLFNSQNQAFHFLLFPRRSRTLVKFNISDFQCFPFPWSVINLSVLKMVYSDSLVTWDWGELLDSDNPVLQSRSWLAESISWFGVPGKVCQSIRVDWWILPTQSILGLMEQGTKKSLDYWNLFVLSCVLQACGVKFYLTLGVWATTLVIRSRSNCK